MKDTHTDADFVNAIASLARQGSIVLDHPQGGKAVMRPDGQVEHLKPADWPLTHIKQQVKAFDAGSFIAYVNRFKLLSRIGEETEEKTTVFADPVKYALRGIIDYHSGTAPDRAAHVVNYEVPFSEQWSRWRGIDGKLMSQIEFAEFVEENVQDIVEPPAAGFLDLVVGLHAKKKVAFESGVRLQDGSHQLTYAEEIEAKGRGQMLVPSEFAIGIPVFFGGEAYKVRAFLRYRIDEGRLVFAVKLHRRLFTEQTAFGDICASVGDGVDLPVLLAWG
ncbi:MAG: DUF2303 family protein [Armatimonadia bacterium]